MVVPRHRESLSLLARQFQERQIDKTYVARVAGIVERDRGEVNLPLIADWPNRPLQKVCHENGKSALTRWRVLSRELASTLIELTPITGRSHQLRIHMREMGHPILGCDFYAPEAVLQAAPRLLLHATHPIPTSAIRTVLQAYSPTSKHSDGNSIAFRGGIEMHYYDGPRHLPCISRYTCAEWYASPRFLESSLVSLDHLNGEKVIVAKPNHSSTLTHNLWLVVALAIPSPGAGLGFALAGAWPILPLAGIELAALGGALYWVNWKLEYRHVIRVSDDIITVDKGYFVPKRSWYSRGSSPR